MGNSGSSCTDKTDRFFESRKEKIDRLPECGFKTKETKQWEHDRDVYEGIKQYQMTKEFVHNGKLLD
jgi:hypothetical protein